MNEYEHVVSVYNTNVSFNPYSIPSALQELKRWVVWSLVKTTKSKPDSKPSKRPVRLTQNNPHHPSIDIAKWADDDHQYSFEHCLKIYNDNPGIISGLGFIPNPLDGIVVIDYDNYLPVQHNDPRYKYVQALLDTTFIETSQSGNGLHIFLFGNLTDRRNDSAGSGVELYPGKRQSFIAMTGATYNDSPSVVAENQAAIDAHVKEFFSSKHKKDSYHIPDHIPNGNRNSELTRLCGHLFSMYSDIQKVAIEMYRYNQTLCETPLSTEELQTIINSIAARHAGSYSHLLDNICHIKSTNTWYDFRDMCEMSANAMDITHIKDFPGKKDTRPLITKWLAKQDGFLQAAAKTWSPLPFGTQQRLVTLEGRIYVNTWKGFAIDPKPGDVTTWLQHLAHVVPEEDYAAALLWWMAYTVQHPDLKINWQPIIVGVSGAGKDILFKPIAKILGSAYKTIGNKDIKGDFDDGLYQTKLVHISEAKGLSGGAVEYYKRITATEADEIFILNIKKEAKIMQRNICNVVAITNNLDAFKFDVTERRPLVLRAPDVMSELQQHKYLDWLDDGGPAKLFYYLLNYDLSHFKPGIRPFRTTHFDAMYDMTRSDDEIGIEAAVEPFDAISIQLIQHIYDTEGKYTIKGIKAWLEANGWARWDNGSTTRRILKYVDGKQQAKSRSWYVRKNGKFYMSESSIMFDECERVEKLVMSQNSKKF